MYTVPSVLFPSNFYLTFFHLALVDFFLLPTYSDLLSYSLYIYHAVSLQNCSLIFANFFSSHLSLVVYLQRAQERNYFPLVHRKKTHCCVFNMRPPNFRVKANSFYEVSSWASSWWQKINWKIPFVCRDLKGKSQSGGDLEKDVSKWYRISSLNTWVPSNKQCRYQPVACKCQDNCLEGITKHYSVALIYAGLGQDYSITRARNASRQNQFILQLWLFTFVVDLNPYTYH